VARLPPYLAVTLQRYEHKRSVAREAGRLVTREVPCPPCDSNPQKLLLGPKNYSLWRFPI
jgi:hypothetical protein